MNSRNQDWEPRLRESPFLNAHFTDELKKKVRRGSQGESGRRKLAKPIALLASIAIIGLAVFLVLDRTMPWQREGDAFEARHTYYDNGTLLLEVFPEPELKAGTTQGYIFHFTAPFSELKGKELAIEAVHLPSKQTVIAVEPTVVEEPSSGYPSLERFTARFALPLSGMWRYEVRLNDEYYADVVLEVGEPDWELSPTFGWNTYKLVGVPDKIGFINHAFIAGQSNKYMWFFLNSFEKGEGEFEVKAVKQGSHELLSIFRYQSIGALTQLPSMMELPEPGLWRLLTFIDGRLMESIVVEVKK